MLNIIVEQITSLGDGVLMTWSDSDLHALIENYWHTYWGSVKGKANIWCYLCCYSTCVRNT